MRAEHFEQENAKEESATLRALLAETWNYQRFAFERDLPINGGDVTDWLTEFRKRAESALGGREAALAIIKGGDNWRQIGDAAPTPDALAVAIVRDLVAWQVHMGEPWESPAWDRAKSFLAATEPRHDSPAMAAGLAAVDEVPPVDVDCWRKLLDDCREYIMGHGEDRDELLARLNDELESAP